MRVLITGATGFVGPHVANALRALDPAAEIVATARTAVTDAHFGAVDALDVTDPKEVAAWLAANRPTHVVNLAGLAAPGKASLAADAAWHVHLDGAVTLGRAILAEAPDCVLVNAGSGLVYGATAGRPAPLDEDALLDPVDDYAASKAAGDLALGVLARRGLRCVRARPFNHTGPGQTEDFFVPAMAMQIARIEAGLAAPVIRTGNLDAGRDFLDVRDVARAYAAMVARTGDIAPGTILNIASGRAWRMSELLERLLALATVPIGREVDPARMRAADIPLVVGDASRARRMLGWAPVHDLGDTLADVLADCRRRVAAGTA